MINLSNKTKIIITLIWVAILLVSGIVPMFTIITFNGKDIRLFAPDRIGTSFIFAKGFIRPTERFWGEMRGTTVLDTEYGQITLNKHASIRASHNTISQIVRENFEKGLATHSLMVEGIEIPQNINVSFMNDKISTVAINMQEVIVAGIHFRVQMNIGIYSDYERLMSGDNIKIATRGTFIPDYVILSDSTQLDVSQFGGGLFILDNGQWKLDCSPEFSLTAMRPRETEYTRYSSITFEKDWGAFISGEIFEEQQ